MELTLLSEEASQQLVDKLADLVEREVERRMQQKEKRYLMQKEVYDEYDCSSVLLERWEKAGLKKFRHGTRWMYDRRDIEAVIDLIKV
ncbi:DNA-binding protein [Aerococcaceae bacterium zg-B36]|uniref:DNA-binding protein n=1 Tax=Aerococcaceae bacterium zg-252 TaxID=2796928 RepID=UPI001BD82D70|nr:DNA-binding protein [Aerococcaceae bacterium zg-B36]